MPAILQRSFRIECRIQTLWYGDYSLGGELGIERKSAPDFARSVVDGRLFGQMSGLRRNYPRPLLIVEGLRHGVTTFGVEWPQLRGALLCVSVRFQVPVVHASCAWETAELIVSAIRFSSMARAPARRPGWRPRTAPTDRALYVLTGLPGVGPRRARALLSAFGSLEGVLRADEAALSRVAGIGAATACAIRGVAAAPCAPMERI